MARSKSQGMPQEFVVTEAQAPLTAQTAALNSLAQEHAVAQDNAMALARDFGYEGALTVGALEDEIRFYQRRTIEACLELGKRLLLLKELTPHGEFKQRIELLGIDYSIARRFMAATAKFSKCATSRILPAAGTQSKLLELLVLDNGEIAALDAGDSVRGITLDAVETMSVSELRKALRETQETSEARARLIADKDQKLNQLLLETPGKRQQVSLTDWPAEFQGFINQVQAAKREIEHAVGAMDIIRTDAMTLTPAPGEEAALEKARQSLGLELAAAIARAEEVIDAARHMFDNTLGALIDA